MRTMTASVATLALALSAGFAWSEPIGSTVKVVNRVTAELDQGQRALALGDGVNQNELIVTGTDAISEFKFNDDTKVALGSGAKLKLDKFVYDPVKTDGTIAVELVQGAFRFITGVAQKPSYTIKTPTASIAVRGTIFDLYVQGDGTTWLLLHEGGVRVCNSAGGVCRDLDEPSKMMRVTTNGLVGIPICWQGMPGNQSVLFEVAFPFVVNPPSIDVKPIFARDDILRSDCAARQRTTPPVRRAEPEDREPVQEKPRRASKDEDDTPRVKKRPVKEVYTEPEIPKIKIKIKPPKYTPKDDDDDGDDKGKTKDRDKPGNVKPTRYPDQPKKKKPKYTKEDAETAKKIIGIGISIGIGALNKGGGHKGGGDNYPGGSRGDGGGMKYPGGNSRMPQ